MSSAGKPPETGPAKEFRHQVHVDASIDEVWKALSDGAELSRWFPPLARVKPGLGGSIFLSWGPACEGEGPIIIWEPGRRLGWSETHPDPAGPVLISVIFEVQADPARGGTTVKLTHSGFGRGAKWDNMFDSISNGWKFELKSLAHYLRRHKGIDREGVWHPVPSPLSVQQAWRRMCAPAPGGLLQKGSLEGWTEGAPYEFVGPDGRTYRGIVERSVPDKAFAGTIDWLDDALLRVEVERAGDGSMPCVWLSVWGPKKAGAAGVAAAWNDALRRCVAS